LLYTADFKKWINFFTYFHLIIFSLLWVAVILLMEIPFPAIPVYMGIIAGIAWGFMLFLFFEKKAAFPRLLFICLFTIIGVNFFLDTAFYPALLPYQKGSAFANYINENKINKDKVVMLSGNTGHSLAFYSQHIYPVKSSFEVKDGDLVIAPLDSLALLQQKYAGSKIITRINSFGVTGLTLPFLNPKTRVKELDPYVLVELK